LNAKSVLGSANVGRCMGRWRQNTSFAAGDDGDVARRRAVVGHGPARPLWRQPGGGGPVGAGRRRRTSVSVRRPAPRAGRRRRRSPSRALGSQRSVCRAPRRRGRGRGGSPPRTFWRSRARRSRDPAPSTAASYAIVLWVPRSSSNSLARHTSTSARTSVACLTFQMVIGSSNPSGASSSGTTIRRSQSLSRVAVPRARLPNYDRHERIVAAFVRTRIASRESEPPGRAAAKGKLRVRCEGRV